jgi:hypothetical protein
MAQTTSGADTGLLQERNPYSNPETFNPFAKGGTSLSQTSRTLTQYSGVSAYPPGTLLEYYKADQGTDAVNLVFDKDGKFIGQEYFSQGPSGLCEEHKDATGYIFWQSGGCFWNNG